MVHLQKDPTSYHFDGNGFKSSIQNDSNELVSLFFSFLTVLWIHEIILKRTELNFSNFWILYFQHSRISKSLVSKFGTKTEFVIKHLGKTAECKLSFNPSEVSETQLFNYPTLVENRINTIFMFTNQWFYVSITFRKLKNLLFSHKMKLDFRNHLKLSQYHFITN